ncbi:hypothetical protein Leryth_014658 [Lithospermum erythrorhizon]|nr:hypothetical protein Leryth_014658 [Lithospermum erythrorhizon]
MHGLLSTHVSRIYSADHYLPKTLYTKKNHTTNFGQLSWLIFCYRGLCTPTIIVKQQLTAYDESKRVRKKQKQEEQVRGQEQGRGQRSELKVVEEVESQRMIHIAVERNRRKQMNEHLNVLKSLMPRSYVQRGDQASNNWWSYREFVNELEPSPMS